MPCGVQREKAGVPEVDTGKGVRSQISKSLEGHSQEAEVDLVSILKGELEARKWCAGSCLRGLVLDAACWGGQTEGVGWLLQRARWVQARKGLEPE